MIAMVVLAWRRRQWLFVQSLIALLLLFTVVGNDFLSTSLCLWLEKDYRQIDPLRAGPFDAVFVLGGGTAHAPNGQPQLNESGDRLMLAARLYFSGRTPQIVVTGRRLTDTPKRHPANEAALILRQLGIPDRDVIRLGGRNTPEEINAISESTKENNWGRLGLVTSAWHMHRAMQLARRSKIDLKPLPSNFMSESRPWSMLSIIPSADALWKNQRMTKEILANLMGR